MKTRIFLLMSFTLILLHFLSCEDTVDTIGMGSRPDKDRIDVFGDSLVITGETVKDSILYAKTIAGLLGRFYDPNYGELKAGYISQFYPAIGFNEEGFIDVDSIHLNILYTSYVGDSLIPMEVTVYPVTQQLQANYYTNIDFTSLYDKEAPLGKKVYTARNLNISDSLNTINVANGSYKAVSVPLPLSLGKDFYEEYKKYLADKKNGAYASPEALAQFFPGVCIESTLGSGCLLNVERTNIYIYYRREVEKTDSANVVYQDTLVGASVLEVTKEVIQLNNYSGANDAHLLDPSNTTHMYLKTPAGIFAQLVIPMDSIKEKIGNRTFSNVQLSIQAEPASDWQYAWQFPGTGAASNLSKSRSKLLLLEADSIKSFFEEQRTADNKTSYYTTLNTKDYTYTFDNISNLIQYAIKADINPLVLRLAPVQVGYYEYSSSYSGVIPIDYAASPYLRPSAVTLKKDNLKIHILASDLSN